LDLRGRKWRETGEDCIMRSFITCTLQGDQMKVHEMGVTCSTHGRNEKREMHTTFLLGKVKRGEQSEDLGVDEKMILDWIFGK
jgi:hypothetical protein